MRRELKVREIPKWGHYLRQTWEQNFASHLTKTEKDSIYLDHFLWHLCSWERVDALKNEEAIQAFESIRKKKCTIFYQFIDDAYVLNDASSLKVSDLPYDQLHMYYGDIYVMDWDGKWTFMMTHEEECGPYFYSKSSIKLGC